MRASLYRLAVLTGLFLFAWSDAALAFRGGYVRGGGAAVRSRTTWVPGRGVSRSTTAVSRYHSYGYGVGGVRPGFYPGYAPGMAPRNVARRTARRTARRVAYRTSYGTAYYYGAPVVVAPASCSSVYWEGMMVQSCGGAHYVVQNSVYYPIQVE